MNLKLNMIVELASWWKRNGGSQRVDLAALEPLLWRDGGLTIDILVKELKNMGFIVTMTSNGSLLKKYARPLSQAKLDLLRVSWHSMSPEVYRRITGFGDLHKFVNGLESAIDANLKIAVNRVLLKGYTDDLEEQITFIDKYALRLKLLDLYWTTGTAAEYDRFYISPEDALASTRFKNSFINSEPGICQARRSRIRFETGNGGVVEYKLEESAKKENEPCLSCSHRDNCLEGYGDYFRVFPDGTCSLCYLKKDLTFKIFDQGRLIIDRQENLLVEMRERMADLPLRLVLVGQCNYNCGFPDSGKTWCLKQDRGFLFPVRKISHSNSEVPVKQLQIAA